MFLVGKNPDCVRCQVTTSQSQYILATEGCWSLNQNTKFLPSDWFTKEGGQADIYNIGVTEL